VKSIFLACGYLLLVSVSSPSARCEELHSQTPINCGSDKNDKNQESADCLARLKGLVTRSGNILRLSLLNGKSKVYVSNREACARDQVDKCVVFQVLQFYSRLQFFVVSKSYYESGNNELVNRRTGSILEISTTPEFSPSGRYLASADQNDDGDRKYDLAIWSTKTDPPSLEFQYSAKQYQNWEITGWSGDDHIKLKASVNAREGAYDQDAEAVRSDRGWTLVLGKRVDRVQQKPISKPSVLQPSRYLGPLLLPRPI
jgi:hypothetical protein